MLTYIYIYIYIYRTIARLHVRLQARRPAGRQPSLKGFRVCFKLSFQGGSSRVFKPFLKEAGGLTGRRAGRAGISLREGMRVQKRIRAG